MQAYMKSSIFLFLIRTCRTGFFLRKAIGWALREYAKAAPDAVRAYVAEHETELSGLSKREALKHLTHLQSRVASA